MKINCVQRSEEQASTIIQQMESVDGLLELRILGYSPWRIVRFPVSLALQNLSLVSLSLPKFGLLFTFIRSVFDIIRIPRNCNYIVKSYSSALRIRSDLGYEDIYFEDLLQNIPGGLRLYSYNCHGYTMRQRSWNGPNIDVTAIIIIGAILGRLLPINDDGDVYNTIAKSIALKIPTSEFSSTRIQRMFSSFVWQSRLYAILLNYINVRFIFTADTGERALLKAAKISNCRFVELQHGVFSQNHPDALPDSNNLDPNDEGLLLPDLLAVYGNYWANVNQNTLLGKASRIKPVGSSFIDRLRLRRAGRSKHDVTRLLLTSQGIARNNLISIIAEFLDEIRLPIHLDIKLHPTYDIAARDYFDYFSHDERVNVISGLCEPDTASLLIECDVHLSISSACHYDAIGLGVPTIILALPSSEVVHHLAASGEALLVNTGKELACVIQKKKWIDISSSVADKYFNRNFVKNIMEDM